MDSADSSKESNEQGDRDANVEAAFEEPQQPADSDPQNDLSHFRDVLFFLKAIKPLDYGDLTLEDMASIDKLNLSETDITVQELKLLSNLNLLYIHHNRLTGDLNSLFCADDDGATNTTTAGFLSLDVWADCGEGGDNDNNYQPKVLCDCCSTCCPNGNEYGCDP